MDSTVLGWESLAFLLFNIFERMIKNRSRLLFIKFNAISLKLRICLKKLEPLRKNLTGQRWRQGVKEADCQYFLQDVKEQDMRWREDEVVADQGPEP